MSNGTRRNCLEQGAGGGGAVGGIGGALVVFGGHSAVFLGFLLRRTTFGVLCGATASALGGELPIVSSSAATACATGSNSGSTAAVAA